MPTADFTNPSPAYVKRLQETIGDPNWRLNNLYKIQTKEQKLITFKMNNVQRDIHKRVADGGFNRIMHLKSRQVGISTYWLIRMLDECMWTPHTTCAVIAHDLDALNLLFEMITRAYENIPALDLGNGQMWEKPIADRKTTRMLHFKALDSKIYVDLEIRGGTIHKLHISESAFIKDMNKVWAAVQEAVPVRGGRIVVETTANGRGNWFANEWWDDSSTFEKIFYGWQDFHRESREDPNGNEFSPPKSGPLWKYNNEYVMRTLTHEERKIMTEYDLTPQQLSWYRYKLESYQEGERHLMKQENPMTPDEAFIWAEGRFYPEFSRSLHVIPNLPEENGITQTPMGVNKYASLDYGWSNPSSIGLWYVDYDGNCIRYREAYKSHWPIPEQCKWLLKHGFSKVDFCDPSIFAKTQQREGAIESLADEYRRHGILLRRANNDKGAGFPRMRDYLRVRAGHKNPVKGTSPAPTIYFCEQCVDAIREHESIRYQKAPSSTSMDQQAREDHEKSATISHACDDTRYFIVSRPKLPEREEEVPYNTPAYRLRQIENRKKASSTY